MSTHSQPNFVVNEPILWCWPSDGNPDAMPAPRRYLLTWPQIAMTLVFSGAMVWRDYGTGFCTENRCRMSVMFVVFFAAALIMALVKVGGVSSRQLDRALMSIFTDRSFTAFRGYALTPTRLLRLHWDGAIESFPLNDGPVIIQYGNLRIDRPNQRGPALIRKIPKAEQSALFTAIGVARAMRKGQTELPA